MAKITVDDFQGLSLNEDVLSYDHQEIAIICEQHEHLKPLSPGHKRLAEHHGLKAMAYRRIAQRIVDHETLKRINKERETHHMRRQVMTVLMFLLVMILLTGGTVAWAQNGSASLTAGGATQEATVEPVAPEIPEAPPSDALNPVQEVGVLRQILVALGSYLAGIGTIVLAGPRILSSIRNDKALLTFGEYLYKSVPAERQTLITTVGTAAGDLGAIIKEVSDDQPVLSKARDAPLEQATTKFIT